MAARVYRIWIEIDEYDPDTDQWTDVPVDYGPTAAFISLDNSQGARARALAAAQDLAEQLHTATGMFLAAAAPNAAPNDVAS